MDSLNNISLAIRQYIWDNVPALLSRDAIRFPNMDIVQPNNNHWMNVRIDYTSRARITIGQRDFRRTGTLALQLYSPTDFHTVDHETIIQELSDLFDDEYLNTASGEVRFLPSYVLTAGETDNYYLSNVISDFTFTELRT